MDVQKEFTEKSKGAAKEIVSGKQKKKMPYNHPYKFSFIDIIGIAFVATFIGMAIYGVFLTEDEKTRDFIYKMLDSPLMWPTITVIGAWFGNQFQTAFIMSKMKNGYMGMSGVMDPTTMMGMGYGYGGSVVNPYMTQGMWQQPTGQIITDDGQEPVNE